MHWGCHYATALDIEVDPQRRRFGCCQSDLALQRLVECRALETERVRLIALRWHSSGSEVRLGLQVGRGLSVGLKVCLWARAPPDRCALDLCHRLVQCPFDTLFCPAWTRRMRSRTRSECPPSATCCLISWELRASRSRGVSISFKLGTTWSTARPFFASATSQRGPGKRLKSALSLSSLPDESGGISICALSFSLSLSVFLSLPRTSRVLLLPDAADRGGGLTRL